MADAEIAVVSDTHVPSREAEIPEWVKERIREADHTIHAGDFDSPAAYETVLNLAGPDLTAVAGNMDPASLDLPAVGAVETDAATLAVTHGTAASMDEYVETILDAVKEVGGGPTVAVAGHTHDAMDEEFDGVRVLNPGSATGADPADVETMMTVEVEGGELEVEVHEG